MNYSWTTNESVKILSEEVRKLYINEARRLYDDLIRRKLTI